MQQSSCQHVLLSVRLQSIQVFGIQQLDKASSNLNLACSKSSISASNLMMTLLRDVRYPFGSTDIAVPEVVVQDDIFKKDMSVKDGINNIRGTDLPSWKPMSTIASASIHH